MKHYIMLSYITGSGGVQCYVAAKAKCLEELGWHVVVISWNNPKDKEHCLISSLDKYLPNGNPYQSLLACYIPKFMVRKALKRYLEVIGPIKKDEDVIIESWDDKTALWGEMLASRLHGRHFFWTANEHYRNEEHCYKEKMDFYMFKMDRGEIFASLSGANRLFVDYRKYRKGDFLENIITEEPIQDIECPAVDALSKADWNICYIGRDSKDYVPNIYDGVGNFAKRHPDKNIQFVVVGDVITRRQNLDAIKNIENLKITEMGNLYPLPKSLYKKIDVVIAGSGSARHSMDKGVLVITADPFLKNSHGVLGYDTNDSVQKEEGALDMSFDEALERALVEKTWEKQSYKWIKYPSINECTERQLEIIRRATSAIEYYDESKLLEGNIDWTTLMRREKEKIKRMFR